MESRARTLNEISSDSAASERLAMMGNHSTTTAMLISRYTGGSHSHDLHSSSVLT